MTWTTLPRSELTRNLAGWTSDQGDAGKPSLLLIHGVGLRAESWGGMLPLLTAHFRVTAIDLPGHGASPNLPGTATPSPSLSDYTALIAELLDRTEGRSVVVGHSLGALIALDLAIHHADQLDAAVALNAIYRRSAAAAEAVRKRADELSLSQPDASPTIERWFGANPQDDAAIMAERCQHWLETADPEGYRSAYQVFAHRDGPADAELDQLACPALFITGSDEPNSTPAMSQHMAQRVPSGQAVVIENARHMMPMTHAHETCAPIIALPSRMGG